MPAFVARSSIVWGPAASRAHGDPVPARAPSIFQVRAVGSSASPVGSCAAPASANGMPATSVSVGPGDEMPTSGAAGPTTNGALVADAVANPLLTTTIRCAALDGASSFVGTEYEERVIPVTTGSTGPPLPGSYRSW